MCCDYFYLIHLHFNDICHYFERKMYGFRIGNEYILSFYKKDSYSTK